ncbi:hypothetical protein TNCV_1757571 [Trichonephila clavipes]|nr:hypothetical protein TNCV_1757571 [Trichonephila clavipes]
MARRRVENREDQWGTPVRKARVYQESALIEDWGLLPQVEINNLICCTRVHSETEHRKGERNVRCDLTPGWEETFK